jgi:hypothetical protein
MDDARRSPLLLTPLAHESDPRDEVVQALYEELLATDPDTARGMDLDDPQVLRRLRAALSQRDPDGYPFGTNTEGELGFWPVGKDFWPP